MLGSGTRVRLVAQQLHRGRVVGYPTEAVFGLGCDPHNPLALAALLEIKQRDPRKGLIVIASAVKQLRGLVRMLDDRHMQPVYASWPGPVTWIMPAAPSTPKLLSGGRSTVAVRVTAHPVARTLCDAFGGAIVSTSANRSGAPPIRAAHDLRRRFGARLAMILDGDVDHSRSVSTIVDARSGRVLRGGDNGTEQ